jgi:transketolase
LRTAFIEQLTAEARRNPRIFLIVGDLGYSVIERFRTEFPDRFLNVGVAEQNMAGLAAGVASEGYHVFTYSIANFPTLRCLEQIRNDIAYPGLPVTVVSVGAGFSYGALGFSHHGIHDLAAMRCLPNLTILSPCDPGETRQCLSWLSDNARPSYLRLGKANEPDVHQEAPLSPEPLRIKKGEGRLAIVASGGIVLDALAAADLAGRSGVHADVFSMPWLKPLAAEDLSALRDFRDVLVVEEHVRAGGLASLLMEMVGPGVHVHSAAVPEDCFAVGSQPYLRRIAGLDRETLADRLVALHRLGRP